MNKTLRAALCVAGLAAATQAAAQVTFFGRQDFRGPSFTADRAVANFERWGFNDRASSAIVDRGAWQVCEDARFNGHCVVLQPGQYDSLRAMGLNNEISSVRPVDRYASNDEPRRYADNDRWARRRGERLFEAPVTSVRAVVGPPQQRCWVERQDIATNGANVPGAVIGGVLGGILGHQVGEGRGNDVATIGGALAGAAIGGNVDRGPSGTVSRDVQRCDYVPSNAQPDYWDVTYDFRGMEHHVQMTSPPGRTITVNRDGEPRG
jgi:uncharacterized protein YcfJ